MINHPLPLAGPAGGGHPWSLPASRRASAGRWRAAGGDLRERPPRGRHGQRLEQVLVGHHPKAATAREPPAPHTQHRWVRGPGRHRRGTSQV